MRTPKPPKVDPSVVAAREREERRAETARIEETQAYLIGSTRRRLRRTGALGGGSVPIYGPTGGTGLDTLFAGDSQAKPVVARASQTLKFDQFFAGGAAPQGGEAAAQPGPAAADGDDLDKFQGWLKGLKPQ